MIQSLTRSFQDKYESLIDHLKDNGSLCLVTHQNADPDAICASYSLKKLINTFNSKAIVDIITPEGVNEISTNLLKYYTFKTSKVLPLSTLDLIILVDTSSMWTLGSLKNIVGTSSKPIIIIDHHPIESNTLKLSSLTLIDENSTSTCEIIYTLYKELAVDISEPISQLLLTGMMFDTKHFGIATSKTFEIASNLCKLGAKPTISSMILYTPLNISERIARIKASRRCNLFRCDPWIVTTSSISSYQASVARALINLGAHIAIVAGGKKNKVRVNIRCTETFKSATDIHLGKDLAQSIGQNFKGSGGGHSTAAGAVTYIGTSSQILQYSLQILSELLHHPLKKFN